MEGYMNISMLSLRKEAILRRGCLSHLWQETGRRRYSSDADVFPHISPFISDEAKILASKAMRRMSDKTQVFTQPENSSIRTRGSHVNEVVGNSVIACEMLGLNDQLVRSASLGHDIGHVG